MIVKRNSYPLKLLGIEALVRRLPAEDSFQQNRYSEIARVIRAGVNGEKVLSTIFEKYKFPHPHFIFHDVHLKSSGAFQMDTLFLSQQGAIILEVKNIAGVIEFLIEQKQMMRTLENGQVDVFECPSVQLARHKMLLGDWFQANDLHIPIQGAVIFPSARQQIKNIPNDLKILFPLEVPIYLREVMQNSSIIEKSTLAYIVERLRLTHHEYNPFPICEKYNVDPNTIQTGVFCERCGVHGMTSIARGWICESCRYFTKDAHRQAIMEFFMLVDQSLTNSACRDFLHLSSSPKARRLIQQMNLPFVGDNKGRAYYFPLKRMESELSWLNRE